MYFTTDTKTLSTVLDKAMPFVGKNSVLPIIGNLLFSLNGNLLSVTATDMEATLIVQEAVEGGTDGVITIPAKLLNDIVRALPAAAPITFSIDAETCIIDITCANGSYKITGESASDFPQVSGLLVFDALSLRAEVLELVIQRVAFAAGTDMLRPAMTGVLFDFTADGITFVATDAHKLALLKAEAEDLPKDTRFVVPAKVASGILKAIHANADLPVNIKYAKDNAVFSLAGAQLYCRLLEGRFPDYRAVIPKDNPIKVSVGKAELLKAVKRIKLFADKATATICFEVTNNLLTLSAKNEDYGNEAHETVPCSVEGEPIDICFNAQYLSECLQAIDDQVVVMHMSQPNRPILIYPEGNSEHFVLLMPIMKPN